MRSFPLSICLFLCIAVAFAGPPAACACTSSAPPTGTLAGGQIDPVPSGDLYVGVIDTTLATGASVDLGGPSAFLVSDNAPIDLSGVPGATQLKEGGGLFLPKGGPYRVTNTSSQPARIRFIGMGRQGEVKGAHYEMMPVRWGSKYLGGGTVYDVTIDRGPFSANSSTPWHYHTGPAFGVLDGGTWENRQIDGSTVRIPTPGYYVQPAEKVHQLAQVGSGGFALIIQFFPPGQPKTGGGPSRGDNTPTALAAATAISTPLPGATVPSLATPTLALKPSATSSSLSTVTTAGPTFTVPATANPTTANPTTASTTPSASIQAQSPWAMLLGAGGLALLAAVGLWWVRRRRALS